jgi:CheY-like chemotaxis protein
VVDDNPDVLCLFSTFLELVGFDVTTAVDGADALAKAPDGFDAITTDLAMPRMDGCEFLQRLHDLPILPVPVVVVTGQNLDQSVTDSVESCRILSKPCDLEELAVALRSVLSLCSHNRFSCSACPCLPRWSAV